ncbi:nucleoside phosphorylase domain-containing protein [Trichoderma chlorosporum]
MINNSNADAEKRNRDRISGMHERPGGRDQEEAEKRHIAIPGDTPHHDRPHHRQDFRIAIICALPLEYDAVSLLFDQFWDEDELYGRAPGDTNWYTTGRIGKYNVVLALLPNMGTASAAGAAACFRSSFTGLQLAFLVEVCGGVPGKGKDEVFLGDVVIGNGVLHGLGEQYPNGFVVKNTVNESPGRPNKDIRSLIASIETEHGRERLEEKTQHYLKDLQKAAYPGAAEDKLFAATYRHTHRERRLCSLCNDETDSFCEEATRASCIEINCDEGWLIRRERLEFKQNLWPKDEQWPQILIGRIASGNTVMKSGEHWDKIAKQHNVIAFEMEGAGNKVWQPFATATAASVMKAILTRYTLADL